MSNKTIATYEVRTGNGRTVTMSGAASDLGKITKQMQMHADLIEFVRQVNQAIWRGGDMSDVITQGRKLLEMGDGE